MPKQLPPGLVDHPTPYGFALSLRPADLARPIDLQRSSSAGIAALRARGVVIAVSHYAATPESLQEQQPVVTPRLVLAYEGRVDNREEIAYLLGMPRLARQPDGAVLAAAYEAWGARLSAWS